MQETRYQLLWGILTQKRHSKNLKRKSKKPKTSKFERKIERIRAKIINDALVTIRTNLLSNLDKRILEDRQSDAFLRSKSAHPNSLL
jgi:hypothetical protein